MSNIKDNEEQYGKAEMMALNVLNNAYARGNSIVSKAADAAISKFIRKCKSQLGVEMIISPTMLNTNDSHQLHRFFSMNSTRFKRKYDTLTKRNKLTSSNNFITNDSFMMRLVNLPATYIFLKIGQCYRDTLTSVTGAINVMMNDIKFSDTDMHLYIFGRHAYKCAAYISSIVNGREENTFRMYNVQGDRNPNSDVAFKSLYQDTEKREMETIFMEPGLIERITDHIDNYLSNKHLYSGRGIIYKTGILLYGEPGTGKTSLIKALASKYNYDLILIDMASFDSISLDVLTHSINVDDEKYIIALEDIDRVVTANKNADKDDRKLISKLLQFLDSNSSPNEIIFIATTNHIHMLHNVDNGDDALLREGRFDLLVEVCGIKRDKVIEMCKSFNLSKSQIDTILNQIKDMGIDLDTQTIRQSKLQNLILKASGLSLKAEEEEDDGGKVDGSAE